MTALDDYQNPSVSYSVAPVELYGVAKVIDTEGTSIQQDFTSIMTKWKDLRLGWRGASEEEAEGFQKLLNAAVDEFFGNSETQVVGALSRFGTGLEAVAGEYGRTEAAAYYSLHWLASELAVEQANSQRGPGEPEKHYDARDEGVIPRAGVTPPAPADPNAPPDADPPPPIRQQA